ATAGGLPEFIGAADDGEGGLRGAVPELADVLQHKGSLVPADFARPILDIAQDVIARRLAFSHDRR
ncbi:MAG TPA: hypothetical protein VES60_11405, partial [Nakamurella sp.]|nr:hypothetical protein [Nakamurella sp.]